MTTIHFLGAAGEVGRSSFLLEQKKPVLLDCGVKLAEDEEEYPVLDARDIQRLDTIVLSHAHLDHCGFLPYLYRQKTRAKAVMTKPTRDLIQVLLADYLRINQGASPYEQKDVLELLKNTRITEFNEVSNGMTLYPAGHILGAAMTRLELPGKKTLLYTGDINLRETRLLDGAQTGIPADALIIESTYGAKTDKHLSLKASTAQLMKTIQKTLDRNGKVLIPTFAIGRGQELLFTLENYMRSGLLETVPIYLDGMVNKVLRIYRHNALYLKREVQHRILTSDDDPFKSEHYKIPQTKDRSDVLSEEKAIILATSGMLNGGPVLHYLKHLAPHPENTLLIVGYQAKGTRGRELVDGARELTLDDHVVPIHMEITETKFSGHSDHQELLQFIRQTQGVKDVFIVHGEKEKAEELAQAAQRVHKNASIHVPSVGEQIKI
ncbi:MBL fold metallo-hydrolase [Candidatus Micrarchaeota archaeon]|nr:MBL fold metallo-hydrolase [Candidatus Micrarchaeota archaeon]